MHRYRIVRFESRDWTVLEGADARTFLVPRRWLPADAREGDVVREMEQEPGADTVSLRLELDPQRTAES